MQRQIRCKENPCYEMTSVHGTPRSLHKADVDKGNKTTGKANKTKAKSTRTITGQKDVEKIVEMRQFDMSYDGGVYEVIANADSKALPQDRQPGFGSDHGVALYDTLNTITQATQQQMDLVRRMMYFMTVLLLIVFLTATSSLILTVMMLISDNTLSSNQPTLSPATTRSTSTQCGESVLLQELKVKISELEETLKLTRTQLDKVEIELEMQKKAVSHLTTQGLSTGAPGPAGPQGPAGPRGLRGPTGLMGPRGFNGTVGPMGPRGVNGTHGAPGSPGPRGPMGPRGVNGSQGPQGIPGVKGLMGPSGYNASQGSSGAWNASRCQYKIKKEVFQPAGSRVTVREDDHPGWKIVGATCSTDRAAEYNFEDGLTDPISNTTAYNCLCKGQSSLFLGSSQMCVMHYWICPFTT